MSAVLTIGNRSCSSRCYEGFPWTTCVCVCGGKNHAVGKDKAEENSKEIMEEMKTLEEAIK